MLLNGLKILVYNLNNYQKNNNLNIDSTTAWNSLYFNNIPLNDYEDVIVSKATSVYIFFIFQINPFKSGFSPTLMSNCNNVFNLYLQLMFLRRKDTPSSSSDEQKSPDVYNITFTSIHNYQKQIHTM